MGSVSSSSGQRNTPTPPSGGGSNIVDNINQGGGIGRNLQQGAISYFSVPYLCHSSSSFQRVSVATTQDDCEQQCTITPQCTAYRLDSECVLFNTSCFTLDREQAEGAHIHVNYARTPAALASVLEQESFELEVTLDSDALTPGTIFQSIDSNFDGLLNTDEVLDFLGGLEFGVENHRLILKGGLLNSADVNASMINELDTRAPYGLIDFGELKSGMTDTFIEGPDGNLAVNRKLEGLAFAAFGLPASVCPDVTPPALPPSPAAPPCAPPPPAVCGPWEEADGYPDPNVVQIMSSSTVASFEECLTVCCDAVSLGSMGVVFHPASGLCEVASNDPIYSPGFTETQFDYGTRSTAVTALLLPQDTRTSLR